MENDNFPPLMPRERLSVGQVLERFGTPDTKTCTKCGERKPLSEFTRSRHTKDGHNYNCRECTRARVRQWLATKDGHAKKKRSGDAWRATPEGRAKKLVSGARLRSRKSGVPFDIIASDILSHLKYGRCALTGRAFSLVPDENFKHNPLAPSIDQIEPGKGYVPGNIQLATYAANCAKGPLSTAQYIELCEDTLRHAGYTVTPPKQTRVIN